MARHERMQRINAACAALRHARETDTPYHWQTVCGWISGTTHGSREIRSCAVCGASEAEIGTPDRYVPSETYWPGFLPFFEQHRHCGREEADRADRE